MPDIHFQLVWEYRDVFLEAFLLTIIMTVLSYLLALALGFLLSCGMRARFVVVRGSIASIVEVLRGVPLVVVLVWIYFALPILTGVDISAFWTGIVGVGAQAAGIVAEDLRSAVREIPKGQQESSRSLGVSRTATFWVVVFPQALRVAMPNLVNDFLFVMKGTAIMAVLSYQELMSASLTLANQIFRPVEVLSAAAVLYFIFGGTAALFGRVLERQFSAGRSLRTLYAPRQRNGKFAKDAG